MHRLVKQPFERIQRSQLVNFTWQGEPMQGFGGDSLASALLANKVRLVGRGFKYGRKRGLLAAGVEEPNAIVQTGCNGYHLPNPRATEVELYQLLRATSAAGIPALERDMRRLLRPLHRYMGAGFYYKTFKWPKKLWPWYEKILRAFTGLGHVPDQPDAEHYDHLYHHPDLLVIGGGFAGMSAALTAAKLGQAVLLVDERPRLGGEGYAEMARDKEATSWFRATNKALSAHPGVTVLCRTSVYYLEDGNLAYGCEARQDHLPLDQRNPHISRQRLHRIRYRQVVLATGAHERPLLFANNDLSGVMLAGAVARYVHEFALLPGSKIMVAGNNNSIYPVALDLLKHLGNEVKSLVVVDQRAKPDARLQQQITDAGGQVLAHSVPVAALGRRHLEAVRTGQLDKDGKITGEQRHKCDLLAVSGGFSPLVHLDCHTGEKPVYNTKLRGFLPALSNSSRHGAGSLLGYVAWKHCVDSGTHAANCAHLAEPTDAAKPIKGEAAATAASKAPMRDSLDVADFYIPSNDHARVFVDLQNDVTQKDIINAVKENFTSIEHIKRYTALGFGTDQGKTGNVLGVAIAAKARGLSMEEIGTTTFRPAYTPVAFGTMAGAAVGQRFDPTRYTPMHQSHLQQGAVMELVGQWHRPRYFPRSDETMQQALSRECLAVRKSLGVMDASTLGKIDIQGPDARELLNRVYTNAWSKLLPGRARYGIMCNENGMIIDDGVTVCLAENHFMMTTTTGGAAHIYQWLETWLQGEWPELKVYVTSVTDHWATTAVVGPKARLLLKSICKDVDFSPQAFKFMEWRPGTIGGLQVRIMRISFSGELAYEINVQANYGRFIWEKVLHAGKRWDITPYGTEAMHVLRAEKGYIIVGQDTDGSITPQDAGLDWAVNKAKPYSFLGYRSTQRSDCLRKDRRQLVGLLPEAPDYVPPEGCQLVAKAQDTATIGYVTSSYFSPILNHSFALAIVNGRHHKPGKTIYAKPIENGQIGQPQPVSISSTVFYDPQGARTNGDL